LETVTISMNNREVSGSPGTTILDLARQVGVDIPTLCHHPLLQNVGACRVCLVEEMKTGRLLASCVTPIAQGMEVRTDTPSAFQARRGVLELILSDHPSACVICNKGNECVLRTLAKDHGICDPDLDPIRRWRPVEEVNSFIERDLSKCVMCGRCIRVCKDFEAVGAIEYMDRGYDSHPGTMAGTPLEGSECNFCGSCVTVCPTDALAEKDRLSFSSGKELAPGICSYCGTGCHLEYDLVDGRLVGATGVAGAPVNSLSLCVRGHYGQDALSSSDRLTDPLIRDSDGALQESGWNQALERVESRVKQIIASHGPESVGVIAGTQCSNEEIYLAGRFARSILGTPHVDSLACFSSGSVVQGLTGSLKKRRPRASLERISAAETIFLIGARPDYTHPVVARNIRRAVRNGAALVQLDPLTTTLSSFAHIRFMQHLDDQSSVLVQLMKDLVANNLHDEEFLLNNAMNAAEFTAAVRPQPTEDSPPEDVRRAAQVTGKGKRTVFLLGGPVARATQGYIVSRLAVDLALLCGQPENIFCLFEGNNEMGAWEMGCTPDFLPGGLVGEQSHILETLKETWGGEIAFKQGLDTMGMIRAAESGDLKALFLLGVDPHAVFPDTGRTRKALSRIDLVVRTGMFPAVHEELADTVLPTTAVTEMDGTYMNIEARVQRIRKLCDPPGRARPIARILLALAGRLGPPLGFVGARDIFEEIRAVCPGWGELNWDDVKQPGGVALPDPRKTEDAQESSSADSLLVPYIPPDSFSSGPPAPADRPWRALPEEQIVHPGDGVMSRRSFHLSRFSNSNSLRMNPNDAEKVGAEDGTWVTLASDVGEARARLAVDPDVPRSAVVIPAGGPAYILQRLLPWPEEFCPASWDRVFVSVTPVEE